MRWFLPWRWKEGWRLHKHWERHKAHKCSHLDSREHWGRAPLRSRIYRPCTLFECCRLFSVFAARRDNYSAHRTDIYQNHPYVSLSWITVAAQANRCNSPPDRSLISVSKTFSSSLIKNKYQNLWRLHQTYFVGLWRVEHARPFRLLFLELDRHIVVLRLSMIRYCWDFKHLYVKKYWLY